MGAGDRNSWVCGRPLARMTKAVEGAKPYCCSPPARPPAPYRPSPRSPSRKPLRTTTADLLQTSASLPLRPSRRMGPWASRLELPPRPAARTAADVSPGATR